MHYKTKRLIPLQINCRYVQLARGAVFRLSGHQIPQCQQPLTGTRALIARFIQASW